jgi:hypothetical protein
VKAFLRAWVREGGLEIDFNHIRRRTRVGEAVMSGHMAARALKNVTHAAVTHAAAEQIARTLSHFTREFLFFGPSEGSIMTSIISCSDAVSFFGG